MVGSTTNRIAYNVTSASTAPLAVDFRFDDSGWLQLRYAETGAEESQLLVIGTHYTVAGDGTAIEGTVTLTSGFLDTIVGGELVIARFTPAVQEVNLEYNTRFPAVAVENQMDETVMALQDRTDSNFQAGSRAIYLPPNEPSSNPNTLPLPSFRAGKFFAFDSTTGAIEALSTEDAAIRILRYYGLEITSEDVLATISAIAPLRRFTPPTTSTEGLFGQLAIIPSSTSVIMTPPGFDPVTLHEVSYEEFLSLTGNTPEFVPDSSYPFYAYLQDGYPFAHAIYPLEQVPNWQATFYESPSSFASISASSDFPATPALADWSMAPFAITVTAGPSVEARAWINVALTGMTPDWREVTIPDGLYRPEYFGAVGDGVTDDTAAIQAAINAAEAVGGRVQLSSKTYRITDTIVIPAIGFSGTFVSPIYGQRQGHGGIHGSDIFPTASPFLDGSVLLMTTPATDAIRVTASGMATDLHDFGVRFSDVIRFNDTGHGINCDPGLNGSSPTPFTKYGMMGASIRNVFVYGTDGNHYAFNIINCQLSKIDNIQGWGGGGLSWHIDDPIGWFGNSVISASYFCLFVNGTSHAYSLTNTYPGHGVILLDFVRPQAFGFYDSEVIDTDGVTLSDLGTTTADPNIQRLFYASDDTEKISAVGVNMEGSLGFDMELPVVKSGWEWSETWVSSGIATTYSDSTPERYATADLTRISDGTSSADPVLNFPVRAGLTYAFEIEAAFYCIGTGSSNGLRYTVLNPASTGRNFTSVCMTYEGDPVVVGDQTMRTNQQVVSTSGAEMGAPPHTANHRVELKIRGIITPTVNGALALGWGQLASAAVNYTRLAGAFIKVHILTNS